MAFVSVANKPLITSTIRVLTAVVGDASRVGIASSAHLIRIRRLIPLAHTTIADSRRLALALIVPEQVETSRVRRAIRGAFVALVDVHTRRAVAIKARLALAIVALLRFSIENAFGEDVALILLFACIRWLRVGVGSNEIRRREANLAFRVRVGDKQSFSRQFRLGRVCAQLISVGRGAHVEMNALRVLDSERLERVRCADHGHFVMNRSF